ncbi:MAG: ParB N-terminal domain-containing protein, partial [Phycisphaerae bacterium]
MNVEQVPITDIRPSKSNPRRNDSAVDAVARSIQAYGFNNPIITDANLNVAAGHTRLKAAILLGLEIVPVIRVPGLTGTKLTGFAIADNKTAELAEWDDEMLFRLVDDLNRDEEFDLSSIGFSDKELTEMLDKSVEDDEDQTPIAPDVPTTQPGDLYLLGNHRLLCGDASKPKS